MINMSLSKAAKAIDSSFKGNDIMFSGCSTDSRTIKNGNLFIALAGENFDGHDYVSVAEDNGASSIMLEREVNHTKPALLVKDTRKAMGLLARSWRVELSIPLVAITGSNGKTTVKEMVNSILSEISEVHATSGNFNNDIGVPLTLFGLNKKHQYAVIEMGANHPGEIEWLTSIASPNVAVITQCAPSHLEGFGSVEGVAKAKAEIYSGLQSSGTAIINADDEYANFWKESCEHLSQLSFGIESVDADVRAKNINILTESASIKFELSCAQGAVEILLPLSAEHNVMNALAASACCLSLDVSLESIKKGLESMSPIKGRLQIKAGKQGVRIIDDTYNANPKSLAAALKVLSAYQGTRYLVLGDMGELGASAEQLHRDAGKLAKQLGIDKIFTLGELSINTLQGFGSDSFYCESHDELNETLKNHLDGDTTILIKGSRYMQMEKIVQALMEEQE
ncbi:MAG TPA: UDP-N-acetylmuramoyl-tripeptide--D-alanyl-D-alanine ligase [Thiotrichaceae bacterium]|jgi:UDP-N-acetylmuramoyl-tripeptide--D-alanyl-D-alanine ligase|nr:UDP-N-acetylmuramoyl-tripeptide--D-alanyl-D-alanine ligase [Thiotrichaceae bacterium]HIM07165.1 UDP-N-acetylmuramoyl-tripeptide--D-alanyl-D-alanine ligase [Gammaproteobacteria bacterium]